MFVRRGCCGYLDSNGTRSRDKTTPVVAGDEDNSTEKQRRTRETPLAILIDGSPPSKP